MIAPTTPDAFGRFAVLLAATSVAPPTIPRRGAGKALTGRRARSHNGLSKLSQSIAMTKRVSFSRSETHKEQCYPQLERRPATIIRVFSRLILV